MKWGKLLGAVATVAGTIVGGPAGTTAAIIAGSLTGGSAGKDLGKKQAKRTQNVAAPAAAGVVPALLTLIPGVDLAPVMVFITKVLEVGFGCAVSCPEALSGSQEMAGAGVLGLLMSAFHQGAQNIKKSQLPQK
jgi:hypothetical protein